MAFSWSALVTHQTHIANSNHRADLLKIGFKFGCLHVRRENLLELAKIPSFRGIATFLWVTEPSQMDIFDPCFLENLG